jgi:hypothetical protein
LAPPEESATLDTTELVRRFPVNARLMTALFCLMLCCVRAGAAAEESAGAPGDEAGFVPLFNGVDLSGWKGDIWGYKVEDGVISAKPLGNLYTEAEYGDFILRFEFKLTAGANNGIGIRVPMFGRASTAGLELQILDDSAAEFADIKPYQYHGSVYGIVAAERGHLKPLGEWNAQEVHVEGTRVRVTLNGAVILDTDLAPYRDGAPTPDGKEHPGLQRTRGHLSLAGHNSQLYFRNLRIKPLNEAASGK